MVESRRKASSTARRGQQDANSRRDEIIEVAVRIIRQKGYKAARLEDVANELNISRPTIYHHLHSKEDILREIYEQTATMLADIARGIARSDLPPEEKLRSFIVAHSQFVMEHRDRVAVFFQETAHLPKRSATRFKRKRQEYEDMVKGMIEEGIEKGVFRATDATITAYAILGMCNWTYQWYEVEASPPPEAIGDLFASLMAIGNSAKPWLNAC
jgi:AcrR family transcriptional regulator